MISDRLARVNLSIPHLSFANRLTAKVALNSQAFHILAKYHKNVFGVGIIRPTIGKLYRFQV